MVLKMRLKNRFLIVLIVATIGVIAHKPSLIINVVLLFPIRRLLKSVAVPILTFCFLHPFIDLAFSITKLLLPSHFSDLLLKLAKESFVNITFPFSLEL